jgi:hypothetical protein
LISLIPGRIESADMREKQAGVVMLRCLILFLACSLSAQVAQSPKYKVVKAEKPEQTVAALNALADQGYRLILPGPMFILRLETAPPDTYRYIPVDFKGGPVEFLNWLNEQGARGYRWVPWPGADVMEKEPHPRNYEYASPSPHSFHFGRAKTDELSSLVSQGYHPARLAWFSVAIGSPWRELFFEREMGAKSEPERTVDAKAVEIADAMRAGNVMKQVDALAKKGYRYLGPCTSQKGGGLAAMMQKCGQDCGGPFEYRYFDVRDTGQLDKQLSEQGKEGFRVLPHSLMTRPHVLERAAAKKETYAYHVLPSKDLVALEKELNGSGQDGYEPIGYVAHMGVWTGETLLLLEKVSTVSAPPQGPPPSK